jgi:hypothetical protein
VAFTIVTNGWQLDSQLIESTAAVRSESRSGMPQESQRDCPRGLVFER